MDNHLNSLGSIQPLTRNLAPRLTNLPSQVPISSWVERSNAAWSALLRGTTSSRTGRVLNPGLDLDPNPESCTLPLDQLAAVNNAQDSGFTATLGQASKYCVLRPLCGCHMCHYIYITHLILDAKRYNLLTHGIYASLKLDFYSYI